MQSRKTGIALSYVNTFLNMFSGLFLSVFLLDRLGGADYGVYQTISSFANYLVLFEFGTGTVMTRNIALCRGKNDEDAIKKNISTVWVITLILSAVILLISIGFYGGIGFIYQNSFTPEQIISGKRIFVFVTGYLLVSFLNQTLNGLLLAFERYTLHSLLNIIRAILRICTIVALVMSIPSAVCIAVCDMVIGTLIFVVEYIYCKKNLNVSFSWKNFEVGILKEAMPLCIAIFLQTVVNQANNNVDKFIIGIRLTPEVVSLYSIALFIFSIFSSLTTIPISMYGPQITAAIGGGISRKNLAEIMIAPCRLITIIGGGVMFGFFVCGRQFIEIAYGTEYMDAWIIAVILMFPMFFNMVNGVIINVLNAENKRMVRSMVLIVTTALNIVLTCLWIDKWGAIGAAAATLVATLLGQVIAMNIYYGKWLEIPVLYMFKRAFRGILMPQIIATIPAYFCGRIIENSYLSLFLSGVVFVGIFGILYLVFGMSEDEKALFNHILRRK